MYKNIFLYLFLSINTCFAQSTFEAIHYTISIYNIDFIKSELTASTIISIAPKQSISSITLDILKMKVDSIFLNRNQKLTFLQNDSNLIIDLNRNLNDTLLVEIFYHGTPFKDPSSFGGGFYMGADYAYNIGVGFSANPHNLGRAWFPCVDNFTSRSSYSFNIRVDSGYTAVCNGLQTGKTSGPGYSLFHYSLTEKIPAYLASMSVAKYSTLRDTFQGLNGSVPVEINVLKKDSLLALKSFENLKIIFSNFEKRFGPYLWPRIGFNAVPIVGGAMEHATNIAFNASFVDGKKTYESIFAHELSHHWFGNLITCSNAEEMWLNEGFAVFAEYVYMEDLYGKTASINSIRNKHFNVLKSAHIKDGDYYPVNNVPHAYTYGTTVYEKGALVANTLRHYLGDSILMSFLKFYFDKYKFKDRNSVDLKNEINSFTGINVDDFFEGWVNKPGFPDFRIDSFSVKNANQNFLVTINIAQKNLKANHVFLNNKSEVKFLDENGESQIAIIKHSGLYSSDSILLNFKPISALLDVDDKMGDACSDYFETIKGTGKKNFNNAYFSMDIYVNSDSALIQVAHHWIGGDPDLPPDCAISNWHYWKIDGVKKMDFNASGTFAYRPEFDADLINGEETNCVLLYRKNSGAPWKIVPDFILTTGHNVKDNTGSLTDLQLKFGEYAIGKLNKPIGLEEKKLTNKIDLTIFPNPNRGESTVTWKESFYGKLTLVDVTGKLIFEKNIQEKDKSIALKNISKGIYLISIIENNELRAIRKMVVQ